jgi:hypothetical protein
MIGVVIGAVIVVLSDIDRSGDELIDLCLKLIDLCLKLGDCLSLRRYYLRLIDPHREDTRNTMDRQVVIAVCRVATSASKTIGNTISTYAVFDTCLRRIDVPIQYVFVRERTITVFTVMHAYLSIYVVSINKIS